MTVTKPFEITGPEPKLVTAEFPPRGIVMIMVRPPGADIKIDGVSVATSSGSELVKTLRSGTHEIVVSLKGYETVSKTVDLGEEDAQQLTINLKKE